MRSLNTLDKAKLLIKQNTSCTGIWCRGDTCGANQEGKYCPLYVKETNNCHGSTSIGWSVEKQLEYLKEYVAEHSTLRNYLCSDNFNLLGHEVTVEAETANKARYLYSQHNQIPYRDVKVRVSRNLKLKEQ